jgi:hypothetical protein
MATTTNYSWSTPDDTALVKDGAAAIRSLGTAIDTTVFNNAGAAIAKTIVDAKGDIIAATAADTVSRLAVGANDTVLTADSTAGTGLKWAAPAPSASITLLSTTTLSGTSTTISSISSSYTHLYVEAFGVSATAQGARLEVAPNGDTNLTNSASTNSTVTTVSNITAANLQLSGGIDTSFTSTNNFYQFTIYNYAGATRKQILGGGAFVNSSAVWVASGLSGAYNSTSAIASLVFSREGSTFNAGTVKIYGVK